MKKLIVLVIALVFIPLVKAVTIMGREVSVLILTPVILIVVFLIIFLFLIIKDKIKNKGKSAKPSEKIEPLENDAIGEDPLAGDDLALSEEPIAEEPLSDDLAPTEAAPKQQKKPEESKINYLKEIDAIKKKLKDMDEGESGPKLISDINKEINDLIKKFFAEYATIKYKFTYDELEKELKKRNKKVVCFADNLSSVSYGPKGASQNDVRELVNEFKDIVEATSQEELQAIPKFKKETEEKKKKIIMLIKKSERLVKKDVNQARENYKEILAVYDTLINVEKENMRPLIMGFYDKLKS
jgi:hypothetical protein